MPFILTFFLKRRVSKVIQIHVLFPLSEDDGELLAAPLVSLPSKRKLPQYFQRVTEPIDLTTIEQNIVTGVYKTVESFDQDVCRLFSNNVRFYGRTSDVGIAATRLRKIYSVAKLEYVEQLNEILGESVPTSFLPEQEDPGLSIETTFKVNPLGPWQVVYLFMLPRLRSIQGTTNLK